MQTGAGHGLDPKVWGPPAWATLHYLASMANTDQKINDFVSFINSFAKLIPCDKCKEHFSENRQKFDIRNYMADSESLLMWTWLMHDAVNFAQGKKGQDRPAWLEIRAKYFKIDKTDKNATPGSSEDYDPTICTEICGATIAKLQSKGSHSTETQPKSTMKILSRNKQTNRGTK